MKNVVVFFLIGGIFVFGNVVPVMACPGVDICNFQKTTGTIIDVNRKSGRFTVTDQLDRRNKRFYAHPRTLDSFEVGDKVRVYSSPMGKKVLNLKKMTSVVATKNFSP